MTDAPEIKIPKEIEKLSFEYLFLRHDEFFNRVNLYHDPASGLDYIDNDDRFIFFCRAALEATKVLPWMPDIVHANDWQTGLMIAYLKTKYRDDPFFARARSIFTIHNMAYQGVFKAASFEKLGLSDNLFYSTGPFEYWGKLNFMKSAISYADLINTVSERYALEIQSSEEWGCGLEGVLKERSSDIYGIVNGVDYSEWSPSKDKFIPFNYDRSDLAGKKKDKVELVNRIGLPFRKKTLLIGMITRLVDQKGLDLFVDIIDKLFSLDLQLVVLGTGDEKYHKMFTQWEKKYPDRLKIILAYDNELAHWIEAGADAFLMPSRYEPCGLNQLYSLKYGTIPIVRATGGLADTAT